MLNGAGKMDNDWVPTCTFPDMSPATRREEQMEPVRGSIIVIEPPPVPPGVNVADGFVVDMHNVDR